LREGRHAVPPNRACSQLRPYIGPRKDLVG
jgi:hypothetical protein